MTVDVLKKPRTGSPVPPVTPPSNSAPSSYAVVLHAPVSRKDGFMLRVVGKHFCQADAYKQYPDQAEQRASYAQRQAKELVVEMLRKGFLVVATYPSRDIAETKVLSIKEQERIYGGFLPASIKRVSL